MSPAHALIHPGSLSGTVNAAYESIAGGVRLAASERTAVARWIASRQGLTGAYANPFAGFDAERRNGIRLFTGERINSASARHILGEETCRALLRLDARDKSVRQALARATDGLLRCLARAAEDPRHTNPGVFCCGKCTVGLWRHPAAGGLDRQEERLRKGIQIFRQRRDARGGWRSFPFWYTVLLLAEVDLPEARLEPRSVAPQLERAAARTTTNRFEHRRRDLAALALDRV